MNQKKWGEKYRWNRARCKSIKMKIIHLSRSVWQLEPPFDNVMHTIMHAQCEGHYADAEKTSVVMSPEF